MQQSHTSCGPVIRQLELTAALPRMPHKNYCNCQLTAPGLLLRPQAPCHALLPAQS